MRRIKIPQQDFALKRQGGLCTREGVFAGHYGIILKGVTCCSFEGMLGCYVSHLLPFNLLFASPLKFGC